MRMIFSLLVLFCVVAWAVLSAQGVIAYLTLEAQGSGFTRGSNRISAFLRWEFYGLVAAIAAFVFGRLGQLQGSLRVASKAPLWISGGFFALLIVGFLSLLVYARLAG